MKTEPLEKETQNAILAYLEITQRFHYRNNSGAYKTEHGSYVRYGTPGSPDIVCVINGFYIGFEVKRRGGKLSPDQRKFQKELTDNGGYYFLVTSVDDVIKAIHSIP